MKSLNLEQHSSSITLRLLIILLVFVTALNILLPIFIPSPPAVPLSTSVEKDESASEYSAREWTIPLKQVALTVEDSVNFQLHTPEGAAQWRAIIPPGDGYVMLGSGTDKQRFRLSMFHALDCLDIVRQNVLQRKEDRQTLASEEARFCLDYLRQTIQCRSDIQLEQVRSEYGGKSVQPFITHSNCRDWTAVYAEIERLHGGSHLDLALDN